MGSPAGWTAGRTMESGACLCNPAVPKLAGAVVEPPVRRPASRAGLAALVARLARMAGRRFAPLASPGIGVAVGDAVGEEDELAFHGSHPTRRV